MREIIITWIIYLTSAHYVVLAAVSYVICQRFSDVSLLHNAKSSERGSLAIGQSNGGVTLSFGPSFLVGERESQSVNTQ